MSAADEETLWCRTLGVEDGLSQGLATAIAQDGSGFMWFGTLAGLNRWDGYHFQTYRHAAEDDTSLSGAVVLALHVDASGALWVGTTSGLDRFDEGANAFRRFGPLLAEPGRPPVAVSGIASDRAGRIWFASFSSGTLYRLDPRTGEHRRFDVTGGTARWFSALYVDGADSLWIATQPAEGVATRPERGFAVAVFDRASAIGDDLPPARTPFALDDEGGKVLSFTEDDAHRVWLARNGGGLMRFEPATRAVSRLTDDGGPGGLAGGFVQDVAPGPAGDLWVLAHGPEGGSGSVPRTLHRVDPDSLDVRRVTLRELVVTPGSRPRLDRMAIDRSGVIWLAANARGLYYADISAGGFSLYREEVAGTPGLDGSFVRSLGAARSGGVWVGTDKGLMLVRRVAGEVRYLSPSEAGVPLEDRDLAIEALHEDREGRLWIGTRLGLVVVKRGSPTIRRYRHEVNNPRSLADDWVHVIHEDDEGRIRVGTLGGGVSEFDPETESFRNAAGTPAGAGASSSSTINAIFEDLGGTVWVGTGTGLARLMSDGGGTHLEPVVVEPRALGGVTILSIGESPADAGALWVGTEHRGLCRLDVKHGSVTFLTTRNSALPDDTVYGILTDHGGHLWLSTNRGLVRYDPASGSARTYGVERGLQSSEFNARAYLGAPGGEMYFGGVRGLTSFVPERLVDNPNPPVVLVTAVRAYDRDAARPEPRGMVIYRHGAPAGVADIAFARRDLTFDYVALHFTDPPRNRYFYHLDGYDNGWQGPTDELSARYTNLAPGPYLFRVKAESSYGVPSNDEATFAFVIRPPFYATAWFRALAALVVALALFGAFQLRVRSLRGRQAALEREVAERTRELQAALDTLGRQAQALKELDEAKSRFFSNVSHEFRTPLTLTIGPLRDVRDGRHGSIPAEALAEIDTAIENTGRQLELVDQLMALARMDAGRVEFRPRAVRLDECVRHAAAPFEALARRQEVSLGVDVGAGALQASLDEQKLERVIANLLGNALKFTPPGGTVVIGLASEGDGWATIDVEDTGPGIPPQDLPHVFERFYRGGQEGGHVPGTGIGLALAREYVDLHGGEIHASNRPGGGTRFTVRLRVVAVAPAVASASGVPAGDASAAAEPAAAVEPAGAGGLGSAAEPDEQANAGLPTVLVIDDHADMRAYVRKHLAPQYRVIEAARADAALDLVRAQLPDAVVCDVMMPGMDGYAFCRAVKSDPETDFLPVILLTARADAEGRLEGLEGGADDYLTKPFEPAELLARVRNLLRSRERLKARLAEAAPPTPMPAPPVLATPRAVPSAEEVLLGRLREAFDRAAQDEGFDVGALADALGMSRAQLHRRVKEAFDSTPAELIIRYRLERAAQLLEARAGNVAEVAYAVGFKNVSHFVKRFGAHYGQTPAAYAAAAATAGQPSEAEQRVAGPPPNSGLASGRNS